MADTTKPTSLLFEVALQAMRAGKKAKRPNWEEPMYIGRIKENPDKDDIVQDTKYGPARVGLHTADLLATDWIII